MYKFFQFFTALLGWLQIAASPSIIALIIGAVIYLPNPTPIRFAIGLSIILAGLITGIVWATKIWKKKGTIEFLSKVIATPELDEKPTDNSHGTGNEQK